MYNSTFLLKNLSSFVVLFAFFGHTSLCVKKVETQKRSKNALSEVQ
jgi:hypothetical protein